MAEIKDFAKFKQEKSKKLTKDKLYEILDDVVVRWEFHLYRNEIDSLFKEEFKIEEFFYSLDFVAKLEKMNGVNVAVFGPGTLFDEQVGWCVGVVINGDQVASPEMITELHARLFNLLLYKAIKTLS